MVTTSRLAAGLSGLRNRNTRVTNKTLLRVVKGNIEADTILLDDEDDEKNKVLASHGVEEEDAHVSLSPSSLDDVSVASRGVILLAR